MSSIAEKRKIDFSQELLHIDISGPHIPNSEGKRFFMTIIDDYSRYVEVFFLNKKIEAADVIKKYIARQERQFSDRNLLVKAIRSDNGGEYTSKNFSTFFDQMGIHQQLTVPYTPQQNGVSERFNRTLDERAKSMRLGANLPNFSSLKLLLPPLILPTVFLIPLSRSLHMNGLLAKT